MKYVETARKKLARAARLHARQIALRAQYHAKHGWSLQIPAGPWHRAVKQADDASYAASEAVERAVKAGAKLKEIL